MRWYPERESSGRIFVQGSRRWGSIRWIQERDFVTSVGPLRLAHADSRGILLRREPTPLPGPGRFGNGPRSNGQGLGPILRPGNSVRSEGVGTQKFQEGHFFAFEALQQPKKPHHTFRIVARFRGEPLPELIRIVLLLPTPTELHPPDRHSGDDLPHFVPFRGFAKGEFQQQRKS